MWRLKVGKESVGEKEEKWIKSISNHLGRQVWEFCAENDDDDDDEAVIHVVANSSKHLLQQQRRQSSFENARKQFRNNRFHRKQSSDLFLTIQVLSFLSSIPFFFYHSLLISFVKQMSKKFKLDFYRDMKVRINKFSKILIDM